MVTIAVLDVETTGLDHKAHTVIELAIRRIGFDPETAEISTNEPGHSWLQDPGVPLSDFISKMTGISYDDLRDKSIDWALVNELLQSSDLVISHNAAFDRPFIDRSVPASPGKPWGCSVAQINWHAKGFEKAALGYLSEKFGIVTAAHRAKADVDAVVAILSRVDDRTGKPYLLELYRTATMPAIRVEARGTAYEKKDLLKGRRYRWDAAQKFWWKAVRQDLWPEEKQWLEKEIYEGEFAGSESLILPVERFRARE